MHIKQQEKTADLSVTIVRNWCVLSTLTDIIFEKNVSVCQSHLCETLVSEWVQPSSTSSKANSDTMYFNVLRNMSYLGNTTVKPEWLCLQEALDVITFWYVF